MNPERWAIVEELFQKAVELSTLDEREAFVRRECGDDADLADQVIRLVRQDAIETQRVSRVIAGVKGELARDGETRWLDRRIGPYRVLREIGRGGMGVVFEAHRDDSEFQQRVAIKLAPEWQRSPGALERFREERQILAQLQHPCICRLLDGGAVGRSSLEDEDRVPYFVMELVEGESLKSHCAKLSIPERLRLFLRICEAVHYAHQRLIIHRDLKPANILVDSSGSPKLLDFGIAGMAGAASGAMKDRILTPDYSSPEQLRNQPASTRTDVYALGLILFEILTGERGQTADTTSAESLEYSICEKEVVLPSALDHRFRGDLDAIVFKATRKNPDDRYTSVEQFAEDLRAHLDRRPIGPRRFQKGYRARLWLRRNWPVATATAMAVTSLVGGIAAFAYQAKIAEDRFNAVRHLATNILFDVHDKVSELPGSVSVRAMLASTAAEQLEGLSRNAGRNWVLRRELASAYLRLAQVQGPTGSSQIRILEAHNSYERGLAHIEALPATDRSQVELTEGRLLLGFSMVQNSLGRGRPTLIPMVLRAEGIFGDRCQADKKEQICIWWMDAMSARLHALLRAQRTVEAESGLAQLAERATQYFPVGATRNRYLLLHGIYGVRLRMLQQRYTECIRIGREADQLLRGALAVSPDDLFLLRTRFSVNAMHTCFPEPPASEEDKRFLEEALRHGIACAAKLAAKDSADARARVHWAEAESKLGQMLDGTGQRKAAIEALQNSVRLFQSTPSGEDRDVLALHYAAAERLVLVRVSIGQEAEALRVARTFLAMYLQALHIERLPPAEEVLDAHAHFWRAQKSVNRPLADQRRLWEQAAARAGAIAARFPQHSKEILVEYEKFKGQRR